VVRAPIRRGWGGLAAVVVLAGFVGLQLAANPVFDAPRTTLFDLYERTAPRLRGSAPVVIVAIDEASLSRIGQWPWPRQLQARLISGILRQRPAAVGIDLLWPEPDTQSPEEWIRQAGPLPPGAAEALAKMPAHDQELADVLASGPVVIGLHGLRDVGRKGDAGSLPPFRMIGAGAATPEDAPAFDTAPVFDSALRSLPRLDAAAPGHGLMSADPGLGGVIRRMPLFSVVAGRPAPSLGLEMLRLAAQAPWIDVYSNDHSVWAVGVGPLRVDTERDGANWIDFSPHDPRRFVSAADVLAGQVAPDAFTRKLVLIGVTGVGVVDQQMTPLGQMVGSEIHAQFLENVIDGRWPRRPGWAALAEAGLTAAVGALFILMLPRATWRWQALIVFTPVALVFSVGFALWVKTRLLIDAVTPVIGWLLVLSAMVIGALAEADVQRRRLRAELEQRRLAEARADGELEAGRRIQMGILPSADSLAEDRRFDLAAVMVPARRIGGDLYDFFLIDADRLFFAVGDVSGKGVPASLFMALGKSLFKSCALRGEADIGAIVDRANLEISRDNPEMMFITLFAGLLNLASGELTFCNAGHEKPFLLRPGEPPRGIEGPAGPPLCVLDDYAYPTGGLVLAPGDSLCLITDGVTDAANAQGEMLGRDRVATLLARMAPDADSSSVTNGLHRSVEAFVGDAEPSDDLTLLTVRWRGPIEP
jgi:serine phosphatase RsbU (regulator of sigma subunit)